MLNINDEFAPCWAEALFKSDEDAVCTRVREGAVGRHRITSVLGVSLTAMIASPAGAVELAPTIGRGSTLMVVGLVTLVLAALIFALFHWIEAVREKRAETPGDRSDERPSEQNLSPGSVEEVPKLAVVPANPMLDALSRKQGFANSEHDNPAIPEMSRAEADAHLAAAQ